MSASAQFPTTAMPEFTSASAALFVQYTNGDQYPSDATLSGIIGDLWSKLNGVQGARSGYELDPEAVKALVGRVRQAPTSEAKLDTLVQSSVFQSMALRFPESADKAEVEQAIGDTQALVMPTALQSMESRYAIKGAAALQSHDSVDRWMSSNSTAACYGPDYVQIMVAKRATHDWLSPEQEQSLWDKRTAISRQLFTMTKEEGREVMNALQLSDKQIEMVLEYREWCKMASDEVLPKAGKDTTDLFKDSVVAGINTWLKKPA